jgi:alkylhydroperoxidase family enzyme
MARISLVEPQNAPAEVKQLYDSVFKGKPANVHKAMAQRPEILKNFLPFYASVGKGLDKKLYEMIYIRVSMVNHCHY